jgi:hypothetical protein
MPIIFDQRGHDPLLAMFVKDNACKQDKHGAPESIASKPAPTGIACFDRYGVPWTDPKMLDGLLPHAH